MPSARNIVGHGTATALIGLVTLGSLFLSVRNSRNVPVGSVITTGNVVMTTANTQNSSVNTVPSIVIDSGALVTVPSLNTLPGGGARLVASGSSVWKADFTVPTTFASGATLFGVMTECGNVTGTTSGSIVVNRTSTKGSITTGTQIKNGITITTGAYTYNNSGAVIGTKLTAGTSFSFITNPKVSITPDCVIRPLMHEKFGR